MVIEDKNQLTKDKTLFMMLLYPEKVLYPKFDLLLSKYDNYLLIFNFSSDQVSQLFRFFLSYNTENIIK